MPQYFRHNYDGIICNKLHDTLPFWEIFILVNGNAYFCGCFVAVSFQKFGIVKSILHKYFFDRLLA